MEIKNAAYKLSKEFLETLYNIYSPVTVDSILKSFIDGRKTTLRVNKLKTTINDVQRQLRSNGIGFSNSSFLKEAFILNKARESQITKLNCYKEGSIYIQNLSSMLPPMLLDLEKGQTILDMCAAPGGKTTEIAAIIDNQGEITANEINIIRRERLKYNVQKQGASCIEVIGMDGKVLGDTFQEKFDRVLLDAPCSGEGTIELKRRESYKGWSTKFIRENSKLQKKLLESGIKALKKGGILIYSTCTISPEENEEIVDYALNKYPNLRVMNLSINVKNSIQGLNVYKDKKYNDNIKKALRVIPNEEMEGFFVCKLKKK
ncbi:RsmB/NOP family class I SAM-dependent RNA methyltransferase [Clostridium sp. HMP27]|uniref:RsmB/NOP family class I SAM-dependent RNA methyltransferase n=1 Tax=Clostridium sp. HMP27 TaxID=1487921 RepID=UPI00052D47B6|nr:RsmB/NOP family class I SAM-dependent RNA methyltransferase [Clostridium sp. HMP27]KGK87677.1 NOL1/NOP2/sun family RNA methylase [Clostridium sp. HMP27]